MKILREGVAPLFARLLLSVIFVTSTISKLFSWSDNVSYVAAKLPVPRAMLLAALMIELLGSLCLILGFRARIAATVMLAYMIPVTLVFHSFMSTNFEKNLGIMGGLLMVAAYGSGRFSLSDPKPATA
jgi:uncharacterized membrane protein YphA (DoxX/SURF4 family)